MSEYRQGSGFFRDNRGGLLAEENGQNSGFRVVPVYIDDSVVVRVYFFYGLINGLGQALRGHGELHGNDDVKDQVGVGRSLDDAEIVHGDDRVNGLDDFQNLLSQMNRLGIFILHRIHVDHSLAVELLGELPLDIVDGVVKLQDIAGCRHLAVERNDLSSGAVIVDQEVMDTENFRVGQGDLADALDKFWIWGLAQEGIEGILCGRKSRIKDKKAYNQTTPAVYIQRSESSDNRSNKNNGCGESIAQAVGCGGFHGCRLNTIPGGAVIIGHIQLDSDGGGQDHCSQGLEIDGFRVEDLAERGLYQLDGHDQDGG